MKGLKKEREQVTNSFNDKLVLFLLTIYYALTFIYASTTWGRFVFVGIACIIFLLSGATNKGVIRLRFYKLYGYIFLFTLFTFLSSLWAWAPKLTLDKATTLTELLVISVLMFTYVYNRFNIDEVLDVLLWGGIIVAVYSLYYYGIDGLVAVINAGSRLNTEFDNINSLSICWVLAALIALYRLLYNRKYWMSLVICGLVLLIAAAASRKAFVTLIVGVLIILFVKYKGKNKSQSFLNYIALGIVVVLVAYALSQLSVFKGILGRMEGLTDFFSEKGSDESRYTYIQIGLEQWKKTPIAGIGIANSSELLDSSGELATYLHNNFVELLACGGLIGFILFYLRYYQLTIVTIKNIKNNKKNELDWFILTLIIVFLLLDYGLVSYTTKHHYMYIMLIHTYLYGKETKTKESKLE